MRARRLTVAIKPGGKGHIVEPGTLRFQPGDEVTIKKAPDGGVHVLFPQPRLFGCTGRKPIVVPIVRGAAKTLTIGTRVMAGCCDAGKDFADGGSNPRRIFGP